MAGIKYIMKARPERNLEILENSRYAPHPKSIQPFNNKPFIIKKIFSLILVMKNPFIKRANPTKLDNASKTNKMPE